MFLSKLSELKPAVASELIAFAGIVLSGIIAYFTARRTARIELRKQREAFRHSDAERSHAEATDMLQAVGAYLAGGRRTIQRDALGKIAAYKSCCPQNVAEVLSHLETAIRSEDLSLASTHLEKVQQLLRIANENDRKHNH